MSRDGRPVSGETIIESMRVIHDRGNGLGGGFAGYGIYPAFKDLYAMHIMFEDEAGKAACEELLTENMELQAGEEIPVQPNPGITDPPLLWRYFGVPRGEKLAAGDGAADDFMVRLVMRINTTVPGTFVFSSGKNMGVFKAVGFAEDVGEFYRLPDYEAYTWIGHGRFPTNTPGWWGGAHPFNILDWCVVHNGEISSYGINKRYLEMFGYECTLLTDTEVMAYLFDLLIRRHGLPLELACKVIAAPFWKEIDSDEDTEEAGLYRALRITYASALVNGPFAVIVGHSRGMIGLNDRIKLRPLVAAVKDDLLYVSSEESAIRQICPRPDRVWAPDAGEPVIGELRGDA
ncbi:MAG: glutamine amidotransferase family protein [Actinobacteria bacterium]|nr:glutamine amidotransferase family protein [Actinomycetota bacterium]MBU1943893.1 glutamine amidotransferase family protein [Actinomycetota bacterium]MBU2688585.1 glutamine amidotransferase family protein [Actinomycetota bacterium]